jgi:hypothetical protein
MNGTGFIAGRYESRPSMPLTFRNLPTPSSTPVEFQEKARKLREAQLARVGRLSSPKAQFMAPGSEYF